MGMNTLVGLGYIWLLPRYNGSVHVVNLLVFMYLLSLIVAMFDRYRLMYVRRFA